MKSLAGEPPTTPALSGASGSGTPRAARVEPARPEAITSPTSSRPSRQCTPVAHHGGAGLSSGSSSTSSRSSSSAEKRAQVVVGESASSPGRLAEQVAKQVASDGSDEWSVDEEEEPARGGKLLEQVGECGALQASTLVSSFGSSSSSASSLVAHDYALAGRQPEVKRAPADMAEGGGRRHVNEDKTKQQASNATGLSVSPTSKATATRTTKAQNRRTSDGGGTSIMIRNADQALVRQDSRQPSCRSDVKLKNDNSELDERALARLKEEAKLALVDIEPPCQFKEESAKLSTESEVAPTRESDLELELDSDSDSDETLSGDLLGERRIRDTESKREPPNPLESFMNMNAADMIADSGPKRQRQQQQDSWDDSQLADCRAPSPPSLSEASSQTDAIVLPHLRAGLAEPRPPGSSADGCRLSQSPSFDDTKPASALDPERAPSEPGEADAAADDDDKSVGGDLSYGRREEPISHDDVDYDGGDDNNASEPNSRRKPTNRRREGSSPANMMIMDNGGDNGAALFAAGPFEPADPQVGPVEIQQIRQPLSQEQPQSPPEQADLGSRPGEASLGGGGDGDDDDLEPAGRPSGASPKSNEQRRDHFLTLAELEMAAGATTQAPTDFGAALAGQVGPPISSEASTSKARSTTSTLSTRHHSYCSTDDFGANFQQQLDADELLVCLQKPVCAAGSSSRHGIDLDQIGELGQSDDFELDLNEAEPQPSDPPGSALPEPGRMRASDKGSSSQSEPSIEEGPLESSMAKPSQSSSSSSSSSASSESGANGPDKEPSRSSDVRQQVGEISFMEAANGHKNLLPVHSETVEFDYTDVASRLSKQVLDEADLEATSRIREEEAPESCSSASASSGSRLDQARLEAAGDADESQGTRRLAPDETDARSAERKEVEVEPPRSAAAQPQNRAQFRQSSSASPPTTVSELDQDEELSTPSFVDSYKKRVAQICQLADSLVGELISERLDGHNRAPMASDCCSLADAGSGADQARLAACSNDLLMRIDERPTSSAGLPAANADPDKSTTGSDANRRQESVPSSSSSSSSSTCSSSERSSLLLADSRSSVSSTTSASGRSYLCCHPANEPHAAPTTTKRRPEPPEKPVHLKQLQAKQPLPSAVAGTTLPEQKLMAAEGRGARKEPEAAAAAIAVTATSIAAASVLHTSGYAGPLKLSGGVARGSNGKRQANNQQGVLLLQVSADWSGTCVL